jgi:hypothetical protein
MTATLNIKQGATLQLLIDVQNADKTPLDLSTVTVSAAVNDQHGQPVDTLTLTPTSTAGQLWVAQDTAAWPLGQLYSDVKFVSKATGSVLKSDTFYIQVLSAVTP